jgi:hypothetical protein
LLLMLLLLLLSIFTTRGKQREKGIKRRDTGGERREMRW